MIFWQKAANLTPQIYLWREKYDTLAYDRAITTFALRSNCSSAILYGIGASTIDRHNFRF